MFDLDNGQVVDSEWLRCWFVCSERGACCHPTHVWFVQIHKQMICANEWRDGCRRDSVSSIAYTTLGTLFTCFNLLSLGLLQINKIVSITYFFFLPHPSSSFAPLTLTQFTCQYKCLALKLRTHTVAHYLSFRFLQYFLVSFLLCVVLWGVSSFVFCVLVLVPLFLSF